MNFAPSAERLTVVVGAADGGVRVSLIGELDFDETDQLLVAVVDAIDRFVPAHIVLDATELTFLDSAGIRALLHCRDAAERVGAGLSVEGVSPMVYQVLRITELVEFLGVTAAAA